MIRLYFGNIRCGKTTSICRDIVKRQKKYNQLCFANFDQSSCCHNFDIKQLGESFTFPPGSHLHIDESGIEFNNRNYKNLPQSMIKYLKLSGHYQVDIDFWSSLGKIQTLLFVDLLQSSGTFNVSALLLCYVR